MVEFVDYKPQNSVFVLLFFKIEKQPKYLIFLFIRRSRRTPIKWCRLRVMELTK